MQIIVSLLLLGLLSAFRFGRPAGRFLSAVASMTTSSSGIVAKVQDDIKTSTETGSDEALVDAEGPPLLLPPSTSKGDEVRQISLGESLTFEELGPIIINPDGTTRRIANWANLTKSEQESSWRLISARNRRRLKALEEQQKLEKTDSGLTPRDSDSRQTSSEVVNEDKLNSDNSPEHVGTDGEL